MKIDPTRIEVPNKEIERIATEFGCSKEEALKAFISASALATETFNESINQQLKESDGEKATPKLKTYTPREIKAYLDRFIIGQEDYKKRLSIAAAYHFAVVKALRDNGLKELKVKRFRKKNTLICGPSGSGKTYSAEILGDFLDAPTLTIDSTDYTEAGYVGKSSDDMIRELIQIAPGATKLEKADFVEKNGGIIFIDEIDKKAKDGKVIGNDISREGFQRAVLKLIERKHIMVEDPMSPAGQLQGLIDKQQATDSSKPKPKGSISTENILFILGGSFARMDNDLESLIKKRLERGELRTGEDGSVTIRGFVSAATTDKTANIKNFFKYAEADDYIQFGLIPELVGRAPVKTYVNPLSKNDLLRIMTETEDSIVAQYQFEFSIFGIELTFDSDALEWIAQKAENKRTGARALISVFETLLTDFQYELPGRKIKVVKVTKEICESPKDALLAILELSPFEDFISKVKNDHGIELIIEEPLRNKIVEFAKKNNLQVSAAIEQKLKNVAVLNYMDVDTPFKIEEKVLNDPNYFDNLFVKWHQDKLNSINLDQKALP
ncbi:MAG: AAA family ATPase [Nitrospinota bacterium]